MSHTPGPWGWFGGNHGYYLATTHSGRRFVMDFVRMGTQGAQPRFQLNGCMVKGGELVRFEVDRSVMGFKAGKAAPSVYRYDIVEIDHPDARLIAQAWTIPQLKAALEPFTMPGFSEEELAKRVDPAEFKRIMEARAALKAADWEGSQ